jgi:hypothetical protein
MQKEICLGELCLLKPLVLTGYDHSTKTMRFLCQQ